MRKRIVSVVCLVASVVLCRSFSDNRTITTAGSGQEPPGAISQEEELLCDLGLLYDGEASAEPESDTEIAPAVYRIEETEQMPLCDIWECYDGVEGATLTFGDYVYELSEEELLALQERLAREEEYSRLALCKVPGYVNVRSLPSTDGEILGKIYQGSVAEVLELAGENMDWFHISSGSVEGYIKASFFLSGDDAVAAIDDYVQRIARVDISVLNVRKDPSTKQDAVGYLCEGEKVNVLEDCGEWLRVKYRDMEQCYIASKYVTVTEEFRYAVSMEEERLELQRQKELELRKAAQKAMEEAQKPSEKPAAAANYADMDELRDAIVTYALQFVGNPYKSGGNSLTGGTDCSGFTMLIYAEFGYILGRTPTGQMNSDGRSISLADARKGDVICYGSNGKCTHVGIYIGDNQIVHAANKRRGICTSSVDMEPILDVKRIID